MVNMYFVRHWEYAWTNASMQNILTGWCCEQISRAVCGRRCHLMACRSARPNMNRIQREIRCSVMMMMAGEASPCRYSSPLALPSLSPPLLLLTLLLPLLPLSLIRTASLDLRRCSLEELSELPLLTTLWYGLTRMREP